MQRLMNGCDPASGELISSISKYERDAAQGSAASPKKRDAARIAASPKYERDAAQGSAASRKERDAA